MHIALNNLLQRVPKGLRCMDTAPLHKVFAQKGASVIKSRWVEQAAQFVERFHRATEFMLEAKEHVLAMPHFSKPH